MDESVPLRGNMNNTPLRRKSILKLPITQALVVNDDDAERLVRRRSISTTASPSTLNNTPIDRRRTLGLSVLSNVSVQEMNEKMAACIKLNTQNKINMKNAFSLEMIDFMAYMITKQDKSMTSLQMATTSLDVSTKIYGFRVDGVHTEVLRIMGAVEQQNKNNADKSTGVDGEPDQNENSNEGKVKKKKKRSKQRILATVDSLKTVIQTAKPSLLAMCETDVQTSDSLSQAILPLHSTSSFYLQPYNDVILDTVSGEQFLDSNDRCPIPRIEDFTDTDICPALSNFKFLDEPMDSPTQMETDDLSRSDNIYQFDMDASLPQNDDPEQSTMNYFDMEEMTPHVTEEVQLCAQTERQVENIVDFRSILSNSRLINSIGQYSIVPKSLNIHWAGPSYWKVRTVGKPLTNSSIVTRTAHGPSKKRKSLDLVYDSAITVDVKSKYIKGLSITLQTVTTRTGWIEDNVMLPVDMHYDIKQAHKCYLHPMKISSFEELNEKSGEAGNIGEHCDYGDNNMSDDIPDIHADDFPTNDQNGNGLDELMPNSQIPFTKENLVTPPKLAKKIVIGYSTRAKKVDMRELKNTIWDSLIKGPVQGTSEQAIPESISRGIQFHKVYKELPGKLTKTKPDALSFPISFVSLLHLANEKSLIINTLPDMSDVIVKSE